MTKPSFLKLQRELHLLSIELAVSFKKNGSNKN